MSKILLLTALLAVALCNIHLNIKYRSFINGEGLFSESTAKEIYNHYYSPYTTKSDYRFKVFMETLIEIRNHNMGKHSWTKGINDFSDMTFEEFQEERLMEPQHCSATNDLKIRDEIKELGAPASYEWNDFKMVTPVKNQGSCGSCWTFSTVGSMESHWNILGKGRNITFSEQQLVDCAGDFDNHGCNGGLPSHAFEYIRHAGGLESDLTYPYTAKNGHCVFRSEISVGYVRYGSFNITQGDEKELAERLYNAGPIAVSFQVITGFKDYKSGVYSVTKCGTTTKDVNHAVLATGYGVENGKAFWNVKNSWGATWGNNGYFKISRGDNMCAIAQCNSYPLIDRVAMEHLEAKA
jgi:cathepsin H